LVEIITAPPSNSYAAGTATGNIINLVYPRYSKVFDTMYVIRLPGSTTPGFVDIVGVTVIKTFQLADNILTFNLLFLLKQSLVARTDHSTHAKRFY
jgi:hypothetical protein